MRLRSILTLVLAAALATACCPIFGQTVRGSGNVIQETREVTGYGRVQVTGVARAVITQDGREGVTITADDNLMPLISTQVRDGTLFIGLTQDARYGFIEPTQTLEFAVSCDDLLGVTAFGSVEMSVGPLQAETFDLEVSGSSDCTVEDVTTTRVQAWVSGSSILRIAGEAQEQRLELSGSARHEASRLRTDVTRIIASGSANTTVWAANELTVQGSGSAVVQYYGDPQVRETLSGSATVTRVSSEPQ